MEGTCVNCGLLLAAGDTYCGNCGQPTPAPVAAPTGFGWPNSRNGPMPTEDSRNGPMPMEAAAGQRTPNAQYLGLRLIYDKEPEASFDPLGNPRLLVQFVRHALQYFALYFLCGFVSVIVLLFLHLLGLSVGIAVTLGVLGAVLTAIVLGCLFWLLPVPALLSEWKFYRRCCRNGSSPWMTRRRPHRSRSSTSPGRSAGVRPRST
jgi:hypothetical protein